MSLNVIPVSNRTVAWQTATTASGGYTLPQHAYIPHPVMSAISTGHVPSPLAGQVSAGFALPGQIAARPYPLAQAGGTHGIRLVTFKGSPGIG